MHDTIINATGIIYAGSRDVLWSLVCVLCSTVSKEQGVTVVAVCVVYDLFIANQVETFLRKHDYVLYVCVGMILI